MTTTAQEPQSMKEWVERYGKRAVTGKLLADASEAIVEMIGKAFRLRVEPLEQANKDLQARIAALEARPSVKFCGVWESGREYGPGDAVTCKGALWLCRAATTGAPGTDFFGWQLAVKRGQA